jgi:hypothetical protein
MGAFTKAKHIIRLILEVSHESQIAFSICTFADAAEELRY